MIQPVTLTHQGNVAVLCLNNPPVKSLSPAVVGALAAAVDEFEVDRSYAALLIYCEGRTFVAGGDIASFDDPAFSTAPHNATLNRIEGSDRPVVAVLHGTVLGGGLELALACHYRISVPTAEFGLPHGKLGLLPRSLVTH